MNRHYRVEHFPHEQSMFEMTSEIAKPIIDCINTLKVFGGFTFGEVPSYELRIMLISGNLGHSYRKLFLQYNTASRRYRIIMSAPLHQVPEVEELRMTSNRNNNRSSITKQYMAAVKSMLRYISNDVFWADLNQSYNTTQQILTDFTRKYHQMSHEGGSGKKKSVKKTRILK